MISQERLEKLKELFKEDGIDISDAHTLDAGLWLLERVKAVCIPIPPEKETLYHEIVKEIEPLWALYKKSSLADNRAKPCKET